MAVKRFVAPDMHTALNAVRNQLGADAVILATRQLAQGVEVSAAVSAEAVSHKERSVHSTAAQTATELGRYGVGTDELEQEHSSLQSELGGMRNMLQRWMEKQGWQDYATRSPLHAKLWERLRRMGLQSDQIGELLTGLSDEQELSEAWSITLERFALKIPLCGLDPVAQGGVFALIGATGVGKTSCIAKLATRFVLEHAADELALVSTDRFRIAAHEQLRAIGRILGVSVLTVDQDNSLADILESSRDKKLVLVDTAGLNRRHPHFKQQSRELSGLKPAIATVLVMSATSQSDVQEAEIAAYADFAPKAAILTKVDEATSLGESLGVLISAQLPLAYYSNGQAIPEDLQSADARNLVNSALIVARARTLDTENLALDFHNADTTDQESVRHVAGVN